MKRSDDQSIAPRGRLRWYLAPVLAVGSLAGCEPVIDVGGVYFPGWLASTLVGVCAAYCIVLALARSSKTRLLADSGLFFVSLVVGIALAAWWVGFSGF